MDMIAWDDNLSTGVDELDGDHRQLIDCYNMLSGEFIAGCRAAEINRLLALLVEHTEGHFRREEALMDQARYPKSASHREEHRALLQSVTLLQFKAVSATGNPLSSYTLSFLRSWLVNHILDADKVLAQFLLRPSAAVIAAEEPLPLSVAIRAGSSWSETHLL